MEFSQCACVILVCFRLVFKPCKALLEHMSCHGVGHRTEIWFFLLWFRLIFQVKIFCRTCSQISSSVIISGSARYGSHFHPCCILTPEVRIQILVHLDLCYAFHSLLLAHHGGGFTWFQGFHCQTT